MVSISNVYPSKPKIEFKHASSKDWRIIQSIASATWPVAYGQLLPPGQLEYMIDLIYSKDAIKSQMEIKRHEFIIAYLSETSLGFASMEQLFGNSQLMIHKLYLLPEFQGKGYGKEFINHITKRALDKEINNLCLKVFYKNEKAIAFYKRIGFSMEGEEKTDLGNGYEIHDYIMLKKIRT